jgi:hypothetical protein
MAASGPCMSREPCPRDIDRADLAAEGCGNGRSLLAALPHRLQLLPTLRRPIDARLNIGRFCKNWRSRPIFQLAESRLAAERGLKPRRIVSGRMSKKLEKDEVA